MEQVLCRNVDTSKRLALGKEIKAHYISVHFDNTSSIYDVEEVKSKIMVT